MSIAITIHNKPGDLLDRIKIKMTKAQSKALLLGAEIAASEIRRSVRDRLRQHTGTLGSSFRATLLRPGRKHELRSGAISDLVYAHIQDQGGTITPTRAKALTIPVSDRAKKHSRAGASARSFSKKLALIWPSNKRSGVLAEILRGGKLRVHYVLKKSVDIPGVKYIDAAARAARPQIEKVLDKALTDASKDVE